jgi:thiosulfate dehydrogenase (quinone) large subunit
MSAKPSAALKQASWAIVAVAGLWTLFHLYWNFTTHTADDYWGIALLVLFIIGVIVAFAEFARERPALVAVPSSDRFPEPAISKFFFGSEGAAAMWFVVRMNVGAQWLLAGVEKVQSGFNAAAISGFAQGGLAKASGAHASVQGWYAWFLQHVVIPNAGVWAFAITWGEILVGLGVLVGALTGIAAGFGVLMNLNYLLAGTVSINPVLGMFGLFLVFAWRVAGWYGLDQYLLPALGLPWKPGNLFSNGTTNNTDRPVSTHAPA